MLDRLRKWWNKPDPMTAIILWQMDQTMEWVNKWHDTRAWSRLWKRKAKWWRDKYNNPVVLSEWQELQALADRQRALLVKGLAVTLMASGSWQDTNLWEQWVVEVEKELADESN